MDPNVPDFSAVVDIIRSLCVGVVLIGAMLAVLIVVAAEMINSSIQDNTRALEKVASLMEGKSEKSEKGN